jgi:hypothetical protein
MNNMRYLLLLLVPMSFSSVEPYMPSFNKELHQQLQYLDDRDSNNVDETWYTK